MQELSKPQEIAMILVSENGQTYRLTSHQSIFTSRNNAEQQLHDIVLQRQSGRWSSLEGGARGKDGHMYVTAAVWAKEDLAVIRQYETIPSEIDGAMLFQWGMTDTPPATEV
jgi:hypothetical protein